MKAYVELNDVLTLKNSIGNMKNTLDFYAGVISKVENETIEKIVNQQNIINQTANNCINYENATKKELDKAKETYELANKEHKRILASEPQEYEMVSHTKTDGSGNEIATYEQVETSAHRDWRYRLSDVKSKVNVTYQRYEKISDIYENLEDALSKIQFVKENVEENKKQLECILDEISKQVTNCNRFCISASESLNKAYIALSKYNEKSVTVSVVTPLNPSVWNTYIRSTKAVNEATNGKVVIVPSPSSPSNKVDVSWNGKTVEVYEYQKMTSKEAQNGGLVVNKDNDVNELEFAEKIRSADERAFLEDIVNAPCSSEWGESRKNRFVKDENGSEMRVNQLVVHYGVYCDSLTAKQERFDNLKTMFGREENYYTKDAEGAKKFNDDANYVIENCIAKGICGDSEWHLYEDENTGLSAIVITRGGLKDTLMCGESCYNYFYKQMSKKNGTIIERSK